MAHLDLGRGLFNKIKSELFLVSKVERDAKMEGRRMTLVLQPDHKNPATAKPPQPQAGTGPKPNPMTAGAGLNIPPRPAGAPVPAAPAPAAARPAPQPGS